MQCQNTNNTGIRGSTDLEELELDHLDGYRSSKPVRIGNGAANHLQLDIYGELLDAIYLYNKHGSPIAYDLWLSVRDLADHVCTVWDKPDMSIWEVRGNPQNFVYSKIMLWVALDRSLRLADKRSNLPCPNRELWTKTRDKIYDEVMTKGYNEELGCFIQSFESREVLDSAVLIAPLVFFVAPNEPRFLSTLDKILKAPEKGGLTSAGLVYRYNWLHSDDGMSKHSYKNSVDVIRCWRKRRCIFHVHILAC
jgi:GH15 family glucan-1,4-alpha-glucosidase